jgi:thiamine biosynthesis lipoprotein
LILGGCDTRQEVLLTGKTMGTTYHITVITGFFNRAPGLAAKIEERLEQINASMSVYRADSEISRFNALAQSGEPFPISRDFMQVMVVAENLHRLTGGAWDGTVAPLVDLWGFGSKTNHKRVPTAAEIARCRATLGFDQILVSEDGYLVKRNPAVTLDLGSIAKGYGVDQIAELIRANGFADFLVEIGGEVFAAGLRRDGKQWRVGINRPDPASPPDAVYKVVTLQEKALATSGDYRNFFEVDGVHYAHVIDPQTGYPVANGVVSASVLSDTCTFADGLATALMVMGPGPGVALVNRQEATECLIVVRQKDGRLTEFISDGFRSAD